MVIWKSRKYKLETQKRKFEKKQVLSTCKTLDNFLENGFLLINFLIDIQFLLEYSGILQVIGVKGHMHVQQPTYVVASL